MHFHTIELRGNLQWGEYVANAEDYLRSSVNVYAGSKQALVKVRFCDEDAVTLVEMLLASKT